MNLSSNYFKKLAILSVLIFLIPISSLALHRMLSCQQELHHAISICNAQVRGLVFGKRKSYIKQCNEQSKEKFKKCIGVVKNDAMYHDCGIIPTPYPIGPKIVEPNAKYVACFNQFFDNLQLFRKKMHQGNQAKRSKRFNDFVGSEFATLLNCAVKNSSKQRLYSPPFTRPAFTHEALWKYKKPLTVGTKGYLCLTWHSGVDHQWVPAKITRVSGKYLVVKYRHGFKTIGWGQFFPLKHVELRYPTAEQKHEKAMQDEIGKFVSRYSRAIAHQRKDKTKFMLKTPKLTMLHVEKASAEAATLRIDLKQWHAGNGAITLKPVFVDPHLMKLMFSHPRADKFKQYYPKLYKCTVAGNLEKAYLPEVCG